MRHGERMMSRRGFTLIEVMIVLLLVAIVSTGAVIALAPAQEAPVTVAMMADVETFATLQAETYHIRGVYAEPVAVLESGKMRLSPGVQVDSSSFSPHRVYFRVRHPATSQRCSVDLSEALRSARNRVLCFGGTARDSVEQVGIVDEGVAPVADTTAGTVPPVLEVTGVPLAPAVEDPSDLVVQPGELVDRSFLVTNRSATARSYQLSFASSDPGVVALPEAPATVIIPGGVSIQVPFRSTMSSAAAAGQLAAITLAVEDLEEEALVARGTFAAMAGVRVASAVVTAPTDVEVKPESTVVLEWTVRSRSNVARTIDIGAAAGASLVLVAADGIGRVRFDAGEERRVVTRYRLVGPSSAGTVRPVSLTAADAAAGQYRGEAQVAVSTAIALAPPDVVQPADSVVAPGSTVTQTWTVRSRSNATRSYALSVAVEGIGVANVEVAGSSVVSIPENGSVLVQVTYRLNTHVPAGQRTGVRLVARDEAANVETSSVSTVTAAEVPARPVATAPSGVSGVVGDSARMVFVVRNDGNSMRRYAVNVTSSDPAVAAVGAETEAVEIPAFGSVEVPVSVGFPSGPVTSLDAGVTLAVHDADASELAAAASATASRLNRAPTVRLVGPTREYAAGEDVPFTIEATDPDGDVIGIAIDFGDGDSGSGADVRHAYAAPGAYYVRARATDPFGMSGEDAATVRVVAAMVGCMDPEASNYNPSANLPGDCTYGPRLVKTEELIRRFECNWERDYRMYQSIDVWGRMYDYWSDGTMSPAGAPYQISYEEFDLGAVTAAPYALSCEVYNDDWP